MHFYDEIDKFFAENLSQNERYIVSRLSEENHYVKDVIQTSTKDIQMGIADIKELLHEKKELNDPDLVWSIYQVFSSTILSGRVSDVLQIYPLLIGKSKDLESSISYLLSLFSNDITFNNDFCKAQIDIMDERIYCHISRITIYINMWRNSKEELGKVSDRNSDLNHIALSLLENKYEDFYTIDKSEQDGVTNLTYHIKNNYPHEQWIVKRICLLYIFQQPVSNASDMIKQIIDKPENLLDFIVLLEQRIFETYSKNEISSDYAQKLFDDASALVDVADGLAMDLKCIIYEMFLRTALMISVKKSEIASKLIPDEVRENKNIEFLLLEVKLRNRSVELDEVINTCIKYGEYWLFNNYLVEYVTENPTGMKLLIEKYKFVIDIDPSVFLIYVQLINDLEGQDKAINLFLNYQVKYGNLIEFWIIKLRIQYTEEELISVIAKYENGNLKYLSNKGLLVFVNLLMQYKKYEDALRIIKKYEAFNSITFDLVRLKAIALCNIKQELESLSLFKKLFEDGNHSEEIIYYILALSCNNSRTVSASVLSCAEQSENPQILVLAASVFVMKNDVENALKMNIKAMLRTTNTQSNVFSQYIGIETLEDPSKEIIVNGIDIDTVARLKNEENKSEKIYAIHSHQFLPNEPYNWENAIHIYKESAIMMGLFRKKEGDVVIINEFSYIVEEIIPLSTYFFRLSMDKIVANGNAKMISVPVTENDVLDIEQFTRIFKEAIGNDKKQFTWLDQYKDLNQIPMTFYFSKQFVRVTYFQLVSTVFMDKSILYREGADNSEPKHGDYIFSYATLVVLYKLGWKCSSEKLKYAIPETLRKVISDETEKVIRDNNKEHVSFMGINNDQLFMVESTEEEKSQYMQEALKFKSYSEEFIALNNESDMHLNKNYNIDIKDVLGIADYDSIIIAKNTNRILVSAEIIVSGICQMPDISVQFVNIADFLAKEACNIEELFDYVRKMLEYRCTVPFTVNTINRIMEFFEKYTREEKKNVIVQWLQILKIPMDDEKYRTVMYSHIQECISSLKSDEDKGSPIVGGLLCSMLNYSGHKMMVSFSKNGEMTAKIVKLNE